MARTAIRDVVVLLPGITGSVLRKDGRDLWAMSAGGFVNVLLSGGGSLDALALEEDDWRVSDPGDGVVADRLMEEAHLIPGLWKIDGYAAVEEMLLQNFTLERGKNYFPFPYDWRRDNRATAAVLDRSAKVWLADWRRESGREDAELILIGHSMGGLVARYFVEVLGGWEDTRAVITFGTPFYGSVKAIGSLLDGPRKLPGFARTRLRNLARTFPSVHQLVPVYRCVLGAGDSPVKPNEAELPGWRSSWNDHAVDFFATMEEAADKNRSATAWGNGKVTYYPVVGMDQPTPQSVRVRDGSTESFWDLEGRGLTGDGTVPGISAYLDGTEDARVFTPQLHSRLQAEGAMLHHVRGLLGSLDQPSPKDLRSAAPVWFSYRGEDVYLTDDRVTVELSAESHFSESQLPVVEATVALHNRSTGQTPVRRTVTVARQRQTLDLGTLPAGTYEMHVSGDERTVPLSDVLVVAEVPDEQESG
ncbi:lipase/acyltransferase domain-containing protein [Streptomyces rubiginosohelvolus]|uniref:Lecithin:cholesterol acyltransferase n=1 Tax=Streptomyces rubiginosohelvolus TaxID=67362 RepID=A0ABW6FAT0_9ACTN